MRFILEASKARRKAADADAPLAAESSVVRPVVARTPAVAPPDVPPVAQPSAVNAEARPVTVAAAASPAVQPSPIAPAAAGISPPPPAGNEAPAAADSGIVTQITLSSEALQAKPAASAVPALDLKATPRLTGASVPHAPALALPELAAAPARPRLVTMVEPELPQRVLDELGRNATVLVDLTIRADGSVANVAMVSQGPRQLLRFLMPSLSQWKFNALPAERVHRIELVFNGES